MKIPLRINDAFPRTPQALWCIIISLVWMFGVDDRRTLLRYITVRAFKKISKHFNRISTLRCRPIRHSGTEPQSKLTCKISTGALYSLFPQILHRAIFTRLLAHRKSWGIFTKITFKTCRSRTRARRITDSLYGYAKRRNVDLVSLLLLSPTDTHNLITLADCRNSSKSANLVHQVRTAIPWAATDNADSSIDDGSWSRCSSAK